MHTWRKLYKISSIWTIFRLQYSLLVYILLNPLSCTHDILYFCQQCMKMPKMDVTWTAPVTELPGKINFTQFEFCLRLIASIISSVQASFILCVSLGTKSQISLKKWILPMFKNLKIWRVWPWISSKAFLNNVPTFRSFFLFCRTIRYG